jgi:diaminopimelate epimerase
MKENTFKSIGQYIASCCGNSFVIFDCRESGSDLGKSEQSLAVEFIYEFSVDSALFLKKSDHANLKMQIFESDGSESEVCGNGLLLVSHLFSPDIEVSEMANSEIACRINNDNVAVLLDEIYVTETDAESSVLRSFKTESGEPHLIHLVEDVESTDLNRLAILAQNGYPGGVNVDVIEKTRDSSYLIRTYERGVWRETESCGTGSLSSYATTALFDSNAFGQMMEFKSRGGIHRVQKVGNKFILETSRKYCTVKKINLYGALKTQAQHFQEIMLHGENLYKIQNKIKVS